MTQPEPRALEALQEFRSLRGRSVNGESFLAGWDARDAAGPPEILAPPALLPPEGEDYPPRSQWTEKELKVCKQQTIAQMYTIACVPEHYSLVFRNIAFRGGWTGLGSAVFDRLWDDLAEWVSTQGDRRRHQYNDCSAIVAAEKFAEEFDKETCLRPDHWTKEHARAFLAGVTWRDAAGPPKNPAPPASPPPEGFPPRVTSHSQDQICYYWLFSLHPGGSISGKGIEYLSLKEHSTLLAEAKQQGMTDGLQEAARLVNSWIYDKKTREEIYRGLIEKSRPTPSKGDA